MDSSKMTWSSLHAHVDESRYRSRAGAEGACRGDIYRPMLVAQDVGSSGQCGQAVVL